MLGGPDGALLTLPDNVCTSSSAAKTPAAPAPRSPQQPPLPAPRCAPRCRRRRSASASSSSAPPAAAEAHSRHIMPAEIGAAGGAGDAGPSLGPLSACLRRGAAVAPSRPGPVGSCAPVAAAALPRFSPMRRGRSGSSDSCGPAPPIRPRPISSRLGPQPRPARAAPGLPAGAQSRWRRAVADASKDPEGFVGNYRTRSRIRGAGLSSSHSVFSLPAPYHESGLLWENAESSRSEQMYVLEREAQTVKSGAPVGGPAAAPTATHLP